jgi:hypothetical protein
MIIYGTKYDSGIAGSQTSYQFFLTVFDVIPLKVSKITPISFDVTARITSITVPYHHEVKPKKAVTMVSHGSHFQHLGRISPVH